MSAVEQWPWSFEQLLREIFPALDLLSVIDPDIDLQEWGLDSLSMVTLVSELEEHFHVCFDEELLAPEVLTTPGRLWRTTRKLVAASAR